MDQAINSPVAVVAVLAMVVVLMREVFWFIRNAKGGAAASPKAWNGFGKTLERVSENMSRQTTVLDRLVDKCDAVKQDTAEIKIHCKLHNRCED
jgi:hypothetical protein